MGIRAISDTVLEQFASSAGRIGVGADAAAAVARPVRVVVGGDGPAGLATANLLRDAGIDVRVIAPVAQARTGSLMIDRRSWSVLDAVGGAQIVKDAPLDASGSFKMASTRWIESELGAHARARGVHIDAGRTIAGVEQTADGVRVAVAPQRGGGELEHVAADWYVDATGGGSPVARSEMFRRDLFEGTFGALPSQRTFIAARAAALPDRPLGWTAADGSFAINDVREGVLTAYRGVDGVTPPAPLTTDAATALLRQLDVDPTTLIGAPWSFTAQQSLARSAGAGRVLIVGDGAGTVQPVRQAGILLALTDAERAARTIIGTRSASAEAVRDAVATYDAQTRGMHRIFLA